MAQSSRLLNYVESYSIGGFNKTKIYTELNTNYKLDDKVYIVGGNYDNYTLGLGAVPANPYAEYVMGYKIIALDDTENWFVIDRDYDGTNIVSLSTEEAFLTRGHFKKGEFNGGEFNDGVFGGTLTPTECLFNNKQTSFGGSYITNAKVNHCIWLDGIWNGGEWNSKTDNFNGNFKSITAKINNLGTITIDILNNINRNNYNYGYNIWINGLWKNGTWENGTWENGTWENGTWENGIFKSGTWENGIKNNGIHTSLNGRTNWLNGTHENGSMNDCFWEDGTWENGVWNGANNFKISSVIVPTIAPYNVSNSHISVILDDINYMNIFNVGDEILMSYILKSNSYENDQNLYNSVIEHINGNEIIINIPNSITILNDFVNSDYSFARISNSKWRHGVWENGSWNSGYRRAGYVIDSSTIDDSTSGQLVVELKYPDGWNNATLLPDDGLVIGDVITLLNITDSLGNDSINYPLTISGIVNSNPITVALTGAPVSWLNDIIVNDNDESVYLDNTIWENGNFNSGKWESGYFINGEVNSIRNNTIDNFYTIWKNGIWSKVRYNPLNKDHAKWNSGVWEDGVYTYGEWLDGVWKNGHWKQDYIYNPTTSEDNYSSLWRNGIWRNGTWDEGKWLNGTWENGAWLDGVKTSNYSTLTFNYPYYPYYEVINNIQYLRFRFNGSSIFTNPPKIGDTFSIDNVLIGGVTPTTLLDSNSNTISSNSFIIKNVVFDVSNNYTYITLDIQQNYGVILSPSHTGDVTITHLSINVFDNGNFNGGTWENGIFNNGLFENATYWNDGIFNNGTFNNSTWNNGIFNNGTFNNSTWNNGIFNNGLFAGNTWNNGIFNNGNINNTLWNNGTMNGGFMTYSNINNGNFNGGTNNNSIMFNGNLNDGHIFSNGTMNGGNIDGAIFENSIKNSGNVLDGVIRGNSVHNGGNFIGGVWENGVWNNGVWTTSKFESDGFIISDNFGVTSVKMYKLHETTGNYLLNNDFTAGFLNWTNDPEWSPVANAASCTITNPVSGTYDTRLTQSGLNPNIVPGLNYRITYDVISNTHPWDGIGPFSAPLNLIYFEIGLLSFLGGPTTVGTHELTINTNGAGAGLNFIMRATILKSTANPNIVIDNIKFENIISDTISFSPGDEVWTSGLDYRELITDPFIGLDQKGIVSNTADGALTVDYTGTYEIQKTNPLQQNVYTAKGIWKNGDLIKGTMFGLIMKNGNLTKPYLDGCVVENGNANYSVIQQLTDPGLNLTNASLWTGSSSWSFGNGNAVCTPIVADTDVDSVLAGILNTNKYYVIKLKINNNVNHLEDTLKISLGTNEYFVGSCKPGKEYTIFGKCLTNTDFKMSVNSKQQSLLVSNINISNLTIEEVETTRMLNSSTWIDGTANSIILENSQWVGGTSNSNLFSNSTWIDGVSNFTNFYKSTWNDGIWNDGVWSTDKTPNSKWHNGTWNDGIFLDGEFLCGLFKGGIFKYGMFRDGSISGSTKIHDIIFQYGNITYRQYPESILKINNLSLDQEGTSFNLTNSNSTNLLSIEAKDEYDIYKYPSGSYNNTSWSFSQPAYATIFRSSADWLNDDSKIIFRDNLEYYLNNLNNYDDNFDVDFVSANDLNADLSGDGMITSNNTQTSDYIKVTMKNYTIEELNKAGTSNIFDTFRQTGNNEVQMLGGTNVGITTATKIPGILNYGATYNVAGFASIRINNNITSYISIGDEIYMYGTGKFSDVAANISNKDNFYKITSVSWNGSFTTLNTTTPVTGPDPGFLSAKEVEIWVDAFKSDVTTSHTTISINKYGRYLSIFLLGDQTTLYDKNDEVVFSSVSNLNILSYIDNGKTYKLKTVSLNGGNTELVLDIKFNNNFSLSSIDNIEIKKISEFTDFNNFCLGGGGPGTMITSPSGPVSS